MRTTKTQSGKNLKRKVLLVSALAASLLQPTAYADSVIGGQPYAGTIAKEPIPQAVPVMSVNGMPDMTKPAVPPQAKIPKEQAIEKVKALFPQLKDLEANQVQLGNPNSFPPQYQNVWNLDWQITNGRSSYGFNSQVDSITGDLLQINSYNPEEENNETYYPPKFSQEEALEAAKSFIRKASPTVQPDNLQPNDLMKFQSRTLLGPVRYDFSFSLKINGIPAPNESIYLSISGSGEVTSYQRSVANAPYPSAEPKISKETADLKSAEPNILELQYIPIFRFDSGKKDWILGFSPRLFGAMSMDAQTGDFLDFEGNALDPKNFKYTDVAKKAPLFSPASGTGKDGLLTAEEAAELVQRTVGIPEGKTLGSSSMSPYLGPKRQVWNLTWRDQQPDRPFPDSLSATVDAKTGQILHYRTDLLGPPWAQPRKEKTDTPAKTISADGAMEKAVQLVNRLYPNAAEELKLSTGNPQPQMFNKQDYSFQFQRFYNGIPISGDTATINFNASGELTTYFSNQTENLEDAVKGLKATLAKEDAAKKYRSETEAQLQYRTFGGLYTGSEFVQPSVKLVYGLTFHDPAKLGYVLDAVDGKWRPAYINPSLQTAEGGSTAPADIVGHWAQEDLKTMIQYGVLQPDTEGKLGPDVQITYGDWLVMFARAVSPMYDNQFAALATQSKTILPDIDEKSPYYGAARLFIESKWLDPKKTPKPDLGAALTREQLAESLVRIVKYDKLASLLQDHLYLEFHDEDQIADKGAVILASQLGLMTGIDGSFKPKEAVTKAQAAGVLMKLVRLQGKLDQRMTH